MAAAHTVFVKLLGEAVDVWRPVSAHHLEEDRYRLTATDGYDLADELWEFAPGSDVICEQRRLSDGDALVAVLRNRRLGRLFAYRGTFDAEWPAVVDGRVPAHVLPVRQERRD